MANETLDIDAEMAAQAQDGLPLLLMALYEKIHLPALCAVDYGGGQKEYETAARPEAGHAGVSGVRHSGSGEYFALA